MAEESAVNYWEVRRPYRCVYHYIFFMSPNQKYGHVAFDTAQKAVLTSCVLRYKPSPASFSGPTPPSGLVSNPSSATKKMPGKKDKPALMQEGFINCCFFFYNSERLARDTDIDCWCVYWCVRGVRCTCANHTHIQGILFGIRNHFSTIYSCM